MWHELVEEICIDYFGGKTWKKDFCLFRAVDENGALLGFYAASRGNSLLTIRDNITAPS